MSLLYWHKSIFSFDAGVKFYCRNCGREGHRRHYCPELKDSLIGRQFICRLCGEKGHNRRTCQNSRSRNHGNAVTRNCLCRICRQSGHNRRTCPQVTGVKLSGTHAKRHFPTGSRTCSLCREKGHNIRTCSQRNINPLMINPQFEEGKQNKQWTVSRTKASLINSYGKRWELGKVAHKRGKACSYTQVTDCRHHQYVLLNSLMSFEVQMFGWSSFCSNLKITKLLRPLF